MQVPDRHLGLLGAQVLASQHDWRALQAMAGRADRKAGLSMEHFLAAARWGRCVVGARRSGTWLARPPALRACLVLCCACTRVVGWGEGFRQDSYRPCLPWPSAPLTLPPGPAAAAVPRRAHGAPAEVQRWFIDRITGEGALLRKAQVGKHVWVGGAGPGCGVQAGRLARGEPVPPGSLWGRSAGAAASPPCQLASPAVGGAGWPCMVPLRQECGPA